MAINRIAEPANPPLAIGDWTSIIAYVRALAMGTEIPIRVISTNIVKGAVFYIGGTLYQAEADTAITGTPSDYVKLTPSGDGSTASAAFVPNLSGVTWNSAYCGYYDVSGNLYVFDEWKALTAAAISVIRRQRDVKVTMGTGWLAALAINLASGWTTAFAAALGTNWTTALAAALGANWTTALAATLGSNWPTALASSAGAGILAQLLTVDGAGSGLDADRLQGLSPSSTGAANTIAARSTEGFLLSVGVLITPVFDDLTFPTAGAANCGKVIYREFDNGGVRYGTLWLCRKKRFLVPPYTIYYEWVALNWDVT